MIWRPRGGLWWALPLLLPIFWLSGASLPHTPHLIHALVGIRVSDWLQWLLPLLVRAAVVGLVLSLVAAALGPPALRVLLSPRQATLTGALAVALVWVAWTGLLWAAIRQDEADQFLWQIIAGAAFDIYGLIWLGLGVRAASALRPLQSGLSLLAGAAASVGVSFLGLYLFLTWFADREPEPTVFLVAVFLLFVMGLFVVPASLITAGLAALFAALRLSLVGARTTSGTQGTMPPEPGETPPAPPEE